MHQGHTAGTHAHTLNGNYKHACANVHTFTHTPVHIRGRSNLSRKWPVTMVYSSYTAAPNFLPGPNAKQLCKTVPGRTRHTRMHLGPRGGHRDQIQVRLLFGGGPAAHIGESPAPPLNAGSASVPLPEALTLAPVPAFKPSSAGRHLIYRPSKPGWKDRANLYTLPALRTFAD